MQLNKKLHEKIMKEGKDVFEMLEVYDKTREWPIGRERLDVTLSKRTIKKLRLMREETGKTISKIVEEAVWGI